MGDRYLCVSFVSCILLHKEQHRNEWRVVGGKHVSNSISVRSTGARRGSIKLRDVCVAATAQKKLESSGFGCNNSKVEADHYTSQR